MTMSSVIHENNYVNDEEHEDMPIDDYMATCSGCNSVCCNKCFFADADDTQKVLDESNLFQQTLKQIKTTSAQIK